MYVYRYTDHLTGDSESYCLLLVLCFLPCFEVHASRLSDLVLFRLRRNVNRVTLFKSRMSSSTLFCPFDERALLIIFGLSRFHD